MKLPAAELRGILLIKKYLPLLTVTAQNYLEKKKSSLPNTTMKDCVTLSEQNCLNLSERYRLIT